MDMDHYTGRRADTHGAHPAKDKPQQDDRRGPSGQSHQARQEAVECACIKTPLQKQDGKQSTGTHTEQEAMRWFNEPAPDPHGRTTSRRLERKGNWKAA